MKGGREENGGLAIVQLESSIDVASFRSVTLTRAAQFCYNFAVQERG
jgi:hypothetical protein